MTFFGIIHFFLSFFAYDHSHSNDLKFTAQNVTPCVRVLVSWWRRMVASGTCQVRDLTSATLEGDKVRHGLGGGKQKPLDVAKLVHRSV